VMLDGVLNVGVTPVEVKEGSFGVSRSYQNRQERG